MKKLLSFLTITICLAILFYPETTIGELTGSPGGKTGSPMDNSDCTSCHSVLGTVVTTTNITSNIPVTGYAPGNVYTITANLPPSLDPRGFEITCEENTTNTKTGTFFITNASETQLVNNGNAITHTTAGNSSNSWSFDWEAPAAGTGDVTFYGAFIEAGYPLGVNLGDYLTLSTLSISEAQNPCNLTGGSVYIDYNASPWIMNATVNGMSMYDYSWTDTNGIVIGTANQTPFYTQWCVTITDVMTGCDTIICQDCIADSTAMCGCIMLWMPVCGCDGVMYANSCVADCADVPWTPAISNGLPGGFLPCNQPPPPPPSNCEVEISGDSIICNWGSPQVLTAVPTGNGTPPYTYLWSNGQSNSSILTIVAPGTYCVALTDANGCTATECINVSVQDIPIYSAPSPPIICLGDSIVLEIDTIGFSNIVWVPNGAINTIDRVVDYPTSSTTYVVEAVDSLGCDRRGEIEVLVHPATPLNLMTAPSPPMVCLGDSVVIEVNPSFLNYWWNTGNPLDQGEDRVVIFPTQDFIYVVEALDSNGCESREEIEVFVDTCATSVSDIDEKNIQIYPNPASEEFFINLNSFYFYNIEIIDIIGRVLISRENVNNLIAIQTTGFSEGTYFIRIQTHSDIQIYKIIIDK